MAKKKIIIPKPEEHLLDYGVLQEWGFIWANRVTDPSSGRPVITSYMTEKPYGHTDMFGFFNHISLSCYPGGNIHLKWYLSVIDKTDPLNTLFQGQITCKTTLECILKNTLIFKPKNIS